MSDAWTAQTDWMREHGVMAAQWSQDGKLLACTLGPKPPPAQDPDKVPARPTASQIMAERRRVSLAATSQLIPKDEP